MPQLVKIFFWTIVALVVWWIAQTLFKLVFPPPPIAVALARMSPATRETMRFADIVTNLFATLVRSMAYLGLAWLAAFRRRNWARWAIVLLFLAGEAALLTILAMPRGLARGFGLYLRILSNPVIATSSLLLIAAIVLLFTPPARAWFAPRAV